MTSIFKFGGSSLANADKINKVAEFIVKRLKEMGGELAVVVSAMGKTTNALDKLAHDVGGQEVKQTSAAEYANIVSTGEYISACALSLALKKLGVESEVLTADNLIFAKGNNYTSERITKINTERLKNVLKNKVAIVCGFQGVNKLGKRVLLGRGGSDTTAVALGAALNAKVYIYTDVDGFYTLDPNSFNGAKQLKCISLNSALELANTGAKVLDKRALMVANKYKTKVDVLKSCTGQGTSVEENPLESAHIDGISFVKNVSLQQGGVVAENDSLTIYKRMAIKTNGKVKTYVVSNAPNGISCDILTIAGSGLDYYAEFLQKLKAVLVNFKQNIKIVDVLPSTVSIVCSAGNAEKIASALAASFNLTKKLRK